MSQFKISDLFKKKLLPAVTVEHRDSALSIAEAFLEAGLFVMEVTFRTPAAASSIAAISKKYPEMSIGAGTVLSREDLQAARDAGAQFALAPGLNGPLVQSAREMNIPFIPGVMTPSEIEKALALGLKTLKFFPANRSGTTDYFKQVTGPYQHTGLEFIPMGGIHTPNMRAFLDLPGVLAVGGSWLCPPSLVREQEFEQIAEIVSRSAEIAGKRT